MSAPPTGEINPRLTNSTQAFDELIDRFEAAWHSGARPDIDGFASDDIHFRQELLVELIHVEWEWRLKAGESPSEDEYRSRFPELTDNADLWHSLNAILKTWERRRSGSSDSPTVPIERRKFTARLNCPHCHNPVEIVSNSVDGEVTCPSCGSTLNLDAGQSLTWDERQLPTIAEFELLEPVGRGAFGTVYKARDQKLQRIVAIKVPRSGVLETDEDEDRFVREARNVAQLRHPGIVAIHSVGRAETFPYLVSEFIEGVTLSQFLTAKRFNVKDAATLIRDIALALQHAHEEGVVHRDLKPSNIMLTPDGQPRVMDFGFAKRDAGEITMTLDGQILGTPAYMSPEQARGRSHQADARSDVYSVGVILFQLLTGELPFRGDVRMLLHQVLHDEAPNPRKLNHQTPRDLDTICVKCMAKEPVRRYATAGELAGDLQRYLDGKPILARPVSRTERAWRWCRRNPAVAGLSATALLLLVLMAVILTVAYLRESQFAKDAKGLATKEKKAREEAQKLAIANAQLATKEKAEREKAEESAALAVENLRRAVQAQREAKAAFEQTRVSLTLNRVALAERMWSQADVVSATQTLDRCPSDLRDWEWDYVQNLCRGNVRTIGNSINVSAQLDPDRMFSRVASSPDGRTLATLQGRTLMMLEVGTGAIAWSSQLDSGDISSIAFDPDGRYLVATRSQGIRLFDVKSGRAGTIDATWPNVDSNLVSAVRGDRMAGVSQGQTIHVWKPSTGDLIRSIAIAPQRIVRLALSSDGTCLAAMCDDNAVRLWSVNKDSGEQVLLGHPGKVWSLALNADGTRLVSCGTDRSVRLWDVTTGKELLAIHDHSDKVSSVVFSPDGTKIISGSLDGTARVWDATTGQRVSLFGGHVGPILDVALTPDGSRLATASMDQSLKIWDTSVRQGPAICRGHQDGIHSVAFRPDGKHVASGSAGIEDSSIHIWDRNTGREVRVLKGLPEKKGVFALCYSKDGKYLASSGGESRIRLWDAESGELIRSFGEHQSGVLSIDFSPDGRRIVSAGIDKVIHIWDVETGKEERSLSGHTSWIWCVAFSPDGKQIASGSQDRTVRLWDAESGELDSTLIGHTNYVLSLAFFADSRKLASAGSDHTIRVWNLVDGKTLQTLEGHTTAVSKVVIHPDGKRLFSADLNNLIKLWDVPTGIEALSLHGHASAIYSLAINRDGNCIASGSADLTVRLWDIRGNGQ